MPSVNILLDAFFKRILDTFGARVHADFMALSIDARFHALLGHKFWAERRVDAEDMVQIFLVQRLVDPRSAFDQSAAGRNASWRGANGVATA